MIPEDPPRIVWHQTADAHAHQRMAARDDRVEPVGFPPPWPTRPWIYANVIASTNGIVTWTRQSPHDDPVHAIAGGDFTRPGRLADARLLHSLRAHADALSVGAQTLRDQPNLLDVQANLGGSFGDSLARVGTGNGRPPFPILVVYSPSGRLDLDLPVFNTAELTVIIVTTEHGAGRLRLGGSQDKGITILVGGGDTIESPGLVRSHERLLSEFGVRYLDCEGGMVVLAALRRAGLLDEIFVTVTAVRIDPAEHEGVKRLFDFGDGAARLVAEGRTDADAGYVFRRWRFSER